MSITANSGPYVSFGQGTFADYNPEAGPSLFYAGAGLLDPRPYYTYQPGQDFGAATAGFLGFTRILTVNYVPATLSNTAIAAAANATSGTAFTLVSSSGSGVTVGASVTNASTGALVTGLLALNGSSARVSFGSSGTIQLWDPTTLLGRALSITGSASSTGGNFLISGYDCYGYPMSEVIAGPAGATTTNGKKAFKYIASVVPQFTDAHNYSVGTADIFGFPLYSATFNAGADVDVAISWAGAAITSATGYTAGVTTSPATTTTGDVRGTYAVQSASDGSKRLLITQSPSLANISSITGLFGVTQA